MHSNAIEAAAMLDIVMRSRRSVRAFRPDPVPRSLLVEILQVARTAPSNFNSQPWGVYLLTGEAKRALGEALVHASSQPPKFYQEKPCPVPAHHC